MKMRRMKITAILAACALAVSPMTSYAFGFAPAAQTKTETGYVFNAGTVEIGMDAEAGSILAALGNPVKPVFEQDSCAYQGKDRVYTYPEFEVSTYPKAGKEHIASIYVRGKETATPEGIKVGAKAEEVIRAYGANEGKFGIYRYEKGNTELTFYTTAGVVDEYEYVLKQ